MCSYIFIVRFKFIKYCLTLDNYIIQVGLECFTKYVNTIRNSLIAMNFPADFGDNSIGNIYLRTLPKI